ncbi:hypothetical protein K456DRAFT_1835516, partial [Colletotrichum gloeosporioides 23]
LPLVLVYGSHWTVDFAEWKLESLTVWDGFSIGSSALVDRCYRIIACLRRLVKWSREDFAPWFEALMKPKGTA